MSELEPDSDRLGVLDERGHRKFPIPAEVTGYFRTRRNFVYGLLMVFFLALPWLHINGRQLLLLDIAKREFHFFGLTLFAHDAPMFFFLIAIFALGLALSTAVWGRVWCGWACPQTVFIDFVYRRIEIWIEGKYIDRRRRTTGPMNFDKLWRMTAKWTAFLVVSTVFSHSLAALFLGSNNLLSMMSASPSENWTYFWVITGFTGLLAFNFGWFREQFCIIMCPYGRLQSVLMDSTSLAVIYDHERGEPRKGSPAAASGKVGDCVSCRRCVEVCPTGIDIRKGVQLECITCTACIDACDEIMRKVKKPEGLIRYSNSRRTSWVLFKTRALIYIVLMILCAGILIYNLGSRKPLDAFLVRAKGLPYQTSVEDGHEIILNHFRLHLKNQTDRSRIYVLRMELGIEGAAVVTPENPIRFAGHEDKQTHVFVKFPKAQWRSSTKGVFLLQAVDASDEATISLPFQVTGPENGP